MKFLRNDVTFRIVLLLGASFILFISLLRFPFSIHIDQITPYFASELDSYRLLLLDPRTIISHFITGITFTFPLYLYFQKNGFFFAIDLLPRLISALFFIASLALWDNILTLIQVSKPGRLIFFIIVATSPFFLFYGGFLPLVGGYLFYTTLCCWSVIHAARQSRGRYLYLFIATVAGIAAFYTHIIAVVVIPLMMGILTLLYPVEKRQEAKELQTFKIVSIILIGVIAIIGYFTVFYSGSDPIISRLKYSTITETAKDGNVVGLITKVLEREVTQFDIRFLALGSDQFPDTQPGIGQFKEYVNPSQSFWLLDGIGPLGLIGLISYAVPLVIMFIPFKHTKLKILILAQLLGFMGVAPISSFDNPSIPRALPVLFWIPLTIVLLVEYALARRKSAATSTEPQVVETTDMPFFGNADPTFTQVFPFLKGALKENKSMFSFNNILPKNKQVLTSSPNKPEGQISILLIVIFAMISLLSLYSLFTLFSTKFTTAESAKYEVGIREVAAFIRSENNNSQIRIYTSSPVWSFERYLEVYLGPYMLNKVVKYDNVNFLKESLGREYESTYIVTTKKEDLADIGASPMQIGAFWIGHIASTQSVPLMAITNQTVCRDEASYAQRFIEYDLLDYNKVVLRNRDPFRFFVPAKSDCAIKQWSLQHSSSFVIFNNTATFAANVDDTQRAEKTFQLGDSILDGKKALILTQGNVTKDPKRSQSYELGEDTTNSILQIIIPNSQYNSYIIYFDYTIISGNAPVITLFDVDSNVNRPMTKLDVKNNYSFSAPKGHKIIVTVVNVNEQAPSAIKINDIVLNPVLNANLEDEYLEQRIKSQKDFFQPLTQDKNDASHFTGTGQCTDSLLFFNQPLRDYDLTVNGRHITQQPILINGYATGWQLPGSVLCGTLSIDVK